ncbi:hypothetical protein PAMP_013948 [Pampus punctatissimus]
MMMKKKGSKSLAVVALLLASVNCIIPPTKEDLTQISLQGEKYLDEQIENAINGVKEMKSVMQKSSEAHKKFVDALEKTKQQKEESMRTAQEMEAKLEQQEEVCNETMKALWEECKPCLKNTCIKYYSRTCSSGSGLVGRQLEDVLNRTSPFSIWINGEKIDVLEQEGQRQNKEFRDLEEKYIEMADGVDSILSDSMKVADHVHYNPPIFYLSNLLGPSTRRSRSIRTFFHEPFHGFQSLFSPMMGMGRNFFGSMMDLDSDAFSNEDCSGRRPLEGPLKEELEEALAMAERFTQQYNALLKRFEEQMFNTSSILDLFNRQFGWVSTLANNTNPKDNIFNIQTVICKDDEESPGGDTKLGETKVSVQLFDSPPMNFSVPGDIPWTDPKFSEVVAQEALDRYKETSV